MTARSLAIVGGGEHAVVVLEAARSRPGTWNVVGFSDRSRSSRLATREPGIEDFGDDGVFADRLAGDPDHAPALVLGIGAGTRPGDRAATVSRFEPDAEWATIVHVTASVSPSARLGPGTVVGAAAVVQAGVVAGRHVIVNSGAIVEHDVVLGDFSHVAPGAAIGGGTRIGQGAFVGLGARVRDHVVIGDRATIGMGAVVVGDVGPDRTIVGAPAREIDDADD
ncbi:MAG TPA: NeuD/PglB/VioB family sugar acetyltransferase [Candidatus Limnocylindrales bacterium]|nr:NeuD/PglB/VioB family sugar acetyltransferase [Candidatus Limnocylindrales bacterium]